MSEITLIAVAVATLMTYVLLPPGRRQWAVLVFLSLILLIALYGLIAVWGFSFKLVFFILLGALAVAARVLVGRRM